MYFEWEHFRTVRYKPNFCMEKKYAFADLRKLKVRKSQKRLGPQSLIRICGMSANLTNYVSQQNCGFAICGTYLRTGHICILTVQFWKKVSWKIDWLMIFCLLFRYLNSQREATQLHEIDWLMIFFPLFRYLNSQREATQLHEIDWLMIFFFCSQISEQPTRGHAAARSKRADWTGD